MYPFKILHIIKFKNQGEKGQTLCSQILVDVRIKDEGSKVPRKCKTDPNCALLSECLFK